MDRMAAVKIEDVIMAEVLRWWKQRKELFFFDREFVVYEKNTTGCINS